MTPDLRVENLCQRVEAGELNCGENSEGSCIITADGEEFQLKTGAAFSRGGSIIFLTYTEGGEEKTIIEPQIHLSQVPVGAILRTMGGWSRFACRFVGIAEFPKKSFFVEPETSQAQENERVRIALIRLDRLARRQCNPYAGQPAYEPPIDRFFKYVANRFFSKS